jgi:hemerythrin superfamily protein
MDDIYEYLKLDHKKVAKLFELYETAPTPKNKLEIVDLLNQELTVHAISEEETFYKILEQHRQSQKEALHGEKEHQEIKDKLAEIMGMQNANSALDEKVKELKKLVDHHVSDEEGKIFKEAKKIIPQDEALILKEKMHFLKGKILIKEFIE